MDKSGTQNKKLQFKTKNLQKEDEDILKKLERTIRSVNANIDAYQFGQALHSLYDFVWHDFADVYIEYAKTKDTDETKEVLFFTLAQILKLLHPFMPFITEEIYLSMPGEKKLLMIEQWPHA